MALPVTPPELLLVLVLVDLGPLLVPEEAPELERAAGRVEETTEEVAGMETEAVPSSVW